MPQPTPAIKKNPRDLLATWANESTEWVRYIVRNVLHSQAPLQDAEIQTAYHLFLQENDLEKRSFPVEQPLTTNENPADSTESLTIDALMDVVGVNALTEGSTIEPNKGLTILFGENGTGKTGYSRIFKSLAGSRTADKILGDIELESPKPISATVQYTVGTTSDKYTWSGEQGVDPFTRISIFDSPSVRFHVDDELEYVYIPAALALFNDVIAGIKAVQVQAKEDVRTLENSPKVTPDRFPATTEAYKIINNLGPTTDLKKLESLSDRSPDIDDRIRESRQSVAKLEAGTINSEVKLQERIATVVAQSLTIAEALAALDSTKYNSEQAKLINLRRDYETFRDNLFKAADLPADPDDTWDKFIKSGEEYRNHLVTVEAHDAGRCLYCRQTLDSAAITLVEKYSEYLDDAIVNKITETESSIEGINEHLASIETGALSSYIKELEGKDEEDKPPFFDNLEDVHQIFDLVMEATAKLDPIDAEQLLRINSIAADLKKLEENTRQRLSLLKGQAATRDESLAQKKKERDDLEAAFELAKSWPQIKASVLDEKRAQQLNDLSKPLAQLARSVTTLAKTASTELVNNRFGELFEEERLLLRAPELRVVFSGSEGKAKRRKELNGRHKPSKVFSEGEQKVLALADFIAEARLAGTAAPVVFDDPVSSLDHRRVREVAKRISELANETQVIVFTHDIFLTTTLLSLKEKNGNCSYFQITDDNGKGKVARASGPRWDSVKSIAKSINLTIEDARKADGDARAALVRTGYGWIRSWCEVVAETELLQGVSERYQPNIRMTMLAKIKAHALPPAIEVVNRVYEEACRYIDSHSQPLSTLNVVPSLNDLEQHWLELKAARDAYLKA